MNRAIILLLSFLLLLSSAVVAEIMFRTNTVWNYALWEQCDITTLPKHEKLTPEVFYPGEIFSFKMENYGSIENGDIIWIPCGSLGAFKDKMFPSLKQSVVLLIGGGDASFPDECTWAPAEDNEKFISGSRIIHFFVMNSVYLGNSTKVTNVPIGIDFHTKAYKQGKNGPSVAKQESVLSNVIAGAPPLLKRKLRIYSDFQHSDSLGRSTFVRKKIAGGENRTTIFKKINDTGLVEYSKHRMDRLALWKVKSGYAFSVSPWGNGIDCHRTWEDLALGMIVIVKTSPLDSMYEGLRVVIVQEWTDISIHNLHLWLKKFEEMKPSYSERLTNSYWWNKIQTAALPFKNKTHS